ncbi:group III truncated hemoglobin [Urechidicola vernalis]|uniref:Group III truncated hemoglobin n=1 Tax=Urechidicola vernalis TaxID=3075600 RepID=A0ABU2Y283_9FLAO|nr:group III truncated hemoglobin [Urechidicola sp. P050]MDT0551807.1 group III truncated hemoglobin [Urechidicola sp. P050]
MKDLESREDIIKLVITFYNALQNESEELNTLFNDVAKVDWESHLPKMYDFWETLIFHKAAYKGNPMKVHLHLHSLQKLKKKNFDDWLVLFKRTVDELFIGEKAELAKMRAASVATSIQLNTVYKN